MYRLLITCYVAFLCVDAALMYTIVGLRGVFLLVMSIMLFQIVMALYPKKSHLNMALDEQLAKEIALWYFSQRKVEKRAQKEGQK